MVSGMQWAASHSLTSWVDRAFCTLGWRKIANGSVLRVAWLVSLVSWWMLGVAGCGGRAEEQSNGTSTPSGGSPAAGEGSSAGHAGSATVDGQPTFSDTFQDDNPMSGPGLWMGSGITSVLPLDGPGAGPTPGDRAFHIQGTAGSSGIDIMWHTSLPVERLFEGVSFVARTDAPGGAELRVTCGGPEVHYWRTSLRARRGTRPCCSSTASGGKALSNLRHSAMDRTGLLPIRGRTAPCIFCCPPALRMTSGSTMSS